MTRSARTLLPVLALAAALLPAPPCRAYDVYIGGFIKQEQLLDRTAWTFVADHADGYFYHPDGLRKMPLAQRRQIAARFHNKRVIAEANRNIDPNPWVSPPDPANPDALSLAATGFTPYGALVAASGIPTDRWQALAGKYHAAGFPNCFIMTGISIGQKGTGWNDARNDQTRTLIADPASAGCGPDEPVNLYLGSPKWRQSTIDQIAWTHAHGKKFLYLISPNSSGAKFLQNAQNTVRDLEAHGARPDIYGVEYYRVGYDMTPETVKDAKGRAVAANTVTGIAWWLLKHGTGAPGFADLWIADSKGRPWARGIPDPAIAFGRQTLRVPPTGGVYTLSITSKDPVMDYAPVVQAHLTGALTDWKLAVTLGGATVTDALTGKDGYTLTGGQSLLPGTTRHLTLTLTPRTPHPGTLAVAVTLRAHPDSPQVRDALTLATAAP